MPVQEHGPGLRQHRGPDLLGGRLARVQSTVCAGRAAAREAIHVGLVRPGVAAHNVQPSGGSLDGPSAAPDPGSLEGHCGLLLGHGMCVAGASHGYYNLELRNEPSPAYAAVIQVLGLESLGTLICSSLRE